MKKKENRIQHFVPQCYLRNFSPNDTYIFIYDKTERKPFRNAVDKVACDDYFYDLPAKTIENINEIPFGTQFYEKEFFANNVEKIYAKILEKIVNYGNSWLRSENIDEIITKEEKEIFAQLIAIQYLRMPDIRVKYSDARKKQVDCRIDIIKGLLIHEKPKLKKEIESLQFEYDKAFDPILHSEMFADEELYVGIANQIINKHWVYFITDNNDFYTSDNPIVIKPHVKNKAPFYEGFGMYGAEIIFPISSSILLTMLDNNHFKDIEQTSDSFNKITDCKKREYNCIQYMHSNRQTYSYNNDFNLIYTLISCNNGNEFFWTKSKILVNGK